MKTFEIAANRQRGRKKPIPFKVKLSAKEEVTLHINPSAPDALSVLSGEFIAAEEANDGKEVARASSEMLRVLFTAETYATLKKLLASGKITSDDLGQFTEYAIETVTGRPTESQSA